MSYYISLEVTETVLRGILQSLLRAADIRNELNFSSFLNLF